MTEVRNILWVDDEIEMLTPHLLFLREKGFTVTPVANGEDAVSLVRDRSFDLVLLDEMMPGKDGLQTLQEIRHFNPNIPIVMVTKNEEEQIMDQAIGRRADDYLLKPATPNQILLAMRRILDRHKITETQVARDYVQQYAALDASTLGGLDHAGWVDTYLRMIAWDTQLDQYRNTGLNQTHEDQKRTANYEFCRFVVKNYQGLGAEAHRPGSLAGRLPQARLSGVAARQAGGLHRRRLHAPRPVDDDGADARSLVPRRSQALLQHAADRDAVRAQRALRRALPARDPQALSPVVGSRRRRRAQPEPPRARTARIAVEALGRRARRQDALCENLPPGRSGRDDPPSRAAE